jgi:hypothetical protein
MTLARTLWMLNVLLAGGIVASVPLLGIGLRTKKSKDSRQAAAEALACLDGIAPAAQLAAVLSPYILSVSDLDDDDKVVGVIEQMGEATAAERMRRKGPCEASVRALNGFAEYVDAGLIHLPRELRRNAERHRQLVESTALLEPFVWCESLVHRRGRWGYRVLHLRRVVALLRAVSRDDRVRHAILVEDSAHVIELAKPVTRADRLRLRLHLVGGPPKITTRTKVRQKKRQRRLDARLGLAFQGVSVQDPLPW